MGFILVNKGLFLQNSLLSDYGMANHPKSQEFKFCQVQKVSCPQQWGGIDLTQSQLLRCGDPFET